MIQVGTKVKPFTLCNQFNEPVSLDNFHGLKKVIYFYPKDDTPGCTVQACTFGNHYEKFKQNNWVVIGISKDSVKSHENLSKNTICRLSFWPTPIWKLSTNSVSIRKKRCTEKKL